MRATIAAASLRIGAAGSLALALAAAWSPAAAAAPPDERLDLLWQAPQTCPTAETVRAEVRSILSASSSAGHSRTDRVDATVTLTRVGESYRADLIVRSAAGEVVREVESTRCDAVVEAVALLIAFALDPLAVDGDLEDGDGGASGAPPQPSPEPRPIADEPEGPFDHGDAAIDAATDAATDEDPEAAAETPVPPPPPGPPRLQGVAWVGAGRTFGGLPEGGPEVTGGVGIVGPRWRFDLAASFWTPREVASSIVPQARGRLWLWSIAARGGLVLRPRGEPRVLVPLLLGVEVGEVHGRGVDLDRDGSDARAFIGVRADVGGEVALSRRVALWGGVGMLVPFVRPSFAVTIQQAGADPRVVEVATLSSVVGRLQGGLLVRFP